MTVNCCLAGCDTKQQGERCIVWEGKTFCSELHLMQYIGDKIEERVQKLKQTLEPVTKESILREYYV